jgi:anti-sigma regulatory factor (Ser/Thr protein kinase)
MSPHAHRTEYVHLTVPAEPAQLAPLRHAMAEYLAPLPLSPDRRDEIILAVGEAAANAVEHAYRDEPEPGVIDVTFWTESDALCVEVRDHGRWREPPVGSPPDGPSLDGPSLDGHGLGIVLMRRLIDCVLIHHDHRGTNVLLRHPVGRPAPDRAATPPAAPARPAGAHRAGTAPARNRSVHPR